MSECSDLDRSTDAPYPNKYPNLTSLSWVKNHPDAPKYSFVAPGRSGHDDSDDLSDQEYGDPCMNQEKVNEDLNTDLLSLDYAAYGTRSQLQRNTEDRGEGGWKPDSYKPNLSKDFEELGDLDFRWNNMATSADKHISVEEREKSKIQSEENSMADELYDDRRDDQRARGQLLERDSNWQRDVSPEKGKVLIEDIHPKEPTRLNKTVEAKKLNVVSDREWTREANEREQMRRRLEENLIAEQNILSAESLVIPQRQLIKNDTKQYEENKQGDHDYTIKINKPTSQVTDRLHKEKADAESQMDSKFSQVSLDFNSVAFSKGEQKKSAPRIEELVSPVSEKSTPVEVMSSHSKLSTDDFADEDTLYPIRQELLRLSRTIETQTNDNELIKTTPELIPNDLVITIPEIKTAKDGYIYTYTLYKIVTKLPGEHSQEFCVYRRYNDFNWLFEKMTNKYQGHVIPTLPPKNILTVVSKESFEFSENRKKELISFLKKCIKHPFLHSTPELNIFLTDNEGLHLLIKRDQTWNSTPKSAGFWGTVTKIISYTTNRSETQPVFRQITPLDNELQNYDVMFSTLAKRLQGLYQYMTQFLELRIQGAKASTPFLQKLEDIMSRSQEDEPGEKMLLSSQVSRIEDESIKSIKERNENDLKEIISSIEAINLALKRRNDFIQQLGELQQAIEEKSLQTKKRLINDERLDELKREYEFLTEKFEESSKVLLGEVEFFKESIDEGLSKFVANFASNNEQYLKQAMNLWKHNQ